MQTWLDAYLNTTARITRAAAKRDGEILPQSANGDLNLVSNLFLRTLDCVERMFGGRDQVRAAYHRGDPAAAEIASMQNVLPFVYEVLFGEQAKGTSTVAIRATRGLVEDLSNARLPENCAGAVESILAEHSHWYVDVPHHAMLVGDAQVRAVFVVPQRSADGVPTRKFSVALTKPGSDDVIGRLMWLMGRGDIYIGYNLTGGVDPAVVVEQVQEFLGLMLLYRSVADDSRRAPVPRTTADALDRNPRKLAQARKKASLFAVEGLDSPADCFGRGNAARSAGSWRLGWRSEVTGHFKMQPHGPRNGLRKLIWVDAFLRGPVDAPHKAAIEVLR